MGKFLIIHVLPFPGLWQNSSNRFALTDVIVVGCANIANICAEIFANDHRPSLIPTSVLIFVMGWPPSYEPLSLPQSSEYSTKPSIDQAMRSLISYQILPPRSIDRLKKGINLSNVEILTIAKRRFLGVDFWPQSLQPVWFPGWFQYSLNSKNYKMMVLL